MLGYMKAINYYVVVEKIKEAPKKVGGLELTEDQNKDVRYLKGKVISAGNLVEGLNKDDIVHYSFCKSCCRRFNCIFSG